MYLFSKSSIGFLLFEERFSWHFPSPALSIYEYVNCHKYMGDASMNVLFLNSFDKILNSQDVNMSNIQKFYFYFSTNFFFCSRWQSWLGLILVGISFRWVSVCVIAINLSSDHFRIFERCVTFQLYVNFQIVCCLPNISTFIAIDLSTNHLWIFKLCVFR